MREMTFQEENMQTGFSFLEAIVVITLMLVVLGFTLPRLLNAPGFGIERTYQDAQNIATLFGVARTYAAAGKDNDHWGIHLVDDGSTDCGTTTIEDCAVLYKGMSFISRDTSYDTIVLLTGTNGFYGLEETDFYFNKRSGLAQDIVSALPRPIMHLSFNASSTVDISGNGNNGFITGGGMSATSTGCSLDSGCYNFDAFCSTSGARCSFSSAADADDCTGGGGTCRGAYISVADAAALKSGVFSVTAWVRPDHLSSEGSMATPAIIAKINGTAGWVLYNDNATAQICFYVNDPVYKTCSDTLVAGQWYHVAGTFSSTNLSRLYVNGSMYGPLSPGALSAASTALTVGATTTPGYYWHGLIDDVAYYDRGLTEQQVRLLAQYTHPTSTDALDGVSWNIYIQDGPARSTIKIYSTGTTVVTGNND